MREINERRGIGSSGHRNPTNVTLGPESLGSVWDLQPPARACNFTDHRPAKFKGELPARVMLQILKSGSIFKQRVSSGPRK